MRDIAQKCKIPLSFFDAITPDTIDTVPSKYKEWRAKLWWRRALIPTEIACGLSHISVWRNFLQSEKDYLLVFEDDVFVDLEFMDIINHLILQSKDYEFVKLSGQHSSPKRKIKNIGVKNYNLYLNAYGTVDTACYLVNKIGAKKLLDYCATLHMGIDILMDRSFEHGVKYYTVQPYPVSTYWTNTGDLASQIGTEERKLKYDHNNFIFKITFRILRLYTSLRRRCATIKLFCRLNPKK